MNCGQVEEQLSAYLDDMLVPEKRREITVHLQICSHCMMLLAELRQNDMLVARLPRISPRPALARRLFSSPDMLALTGTTHARVPLFDETTQRLTRTCREKHRSHPHLVALPGEHYSQIQGAAMPPTPSPLPLHPTPSNSPRRVRRLLTPLHIAIAALLILALSLALLFRLYAHQHRQRAERRPAHPTSATKGDQ